MAKVRYGPANAGLSGLVDPVKFAVRRAEFEPLTVGRVKHLSEVEGDISKELT